MTGSNRLIPSGDGDSHNSNRSVLPIDNGRIVTLNYKNVLDNGGIPDRDKATGIVHDNRRRKEDSDRASYDSCDFETSIEETGYGKYNILLLLSSISGFIGCYNTTVTIALILPAAECDLKLTNIDKGMMNASTYIGMISSSFLWGFLSDTLGRKKILLIVFALDVVISSVVALAQNLTFLLVAKFISGFVSSGPYAILMAYMSESHSSKHRSRILVWTGMFGGLGSIISPALAWVMIPLPIHLNLWEGAILVQSWRVFLLLCTIPSLLTAVIFSFYPESPKFLMSRGRTEEAMSVFRTMYSMNTGKPKETYPVKSLAVQEGEGAPTAGGGTSGFIRMGLSQARPFVRKPYISYALLIIPMQFLSLAGLNTMRLWSPQLFSTMINSEKSLDGNFVPTTLCQMLDSNVRTVANATEGGDLAYCTDGDVDTAVYSNFMILGAVSSVAYLACGYLVQILGKKLLMMSAYVIAGCIGIGMYWSSTSSMLVAFTSAYVTLTSVSSTTVIGVTVDLFPTTLRTMAVSLAMMFGRCGSMLGNVALPLLLDWNCGVLFFMIAATSFGSGLLALFIPKTKKAALA